MAEKSEKIDKVAMTVIAQDTHIKGEMIFEKSATIQGRFDGRITAKGDLKVADTAACAAEVEAVNIIVDGKVEGNLKASSSIKLNAKARLKGDIVAERLVTAEGASIQGHVSVGPQAKADSPQGARPQAHVGKGKPQQRQEQQGNA